MDFEGRVVRQGVREDVTRRNFHRLLEEIVLQNNEAVVQGGGGAQDALPVLEDLLDWSGAVVDVEVCVKGKIALVPHAKGEARRNELAVSIESRSGRCAGPNDGGKAHGKGDSPDTIATYFI